MFGENPTKLSSLEIIYLRWASQGKSLSEIVAIEGGNVEDIQTYLDQATLVLDAKSLTEAIRKAKDHQII
ncbi:hypothetical protein [Rhizobium sp. A37_96]